MRSCTLRLAAILLVLLAHSAQAADDGVAPEPSAPQAATTPADGWGAAPEPMVPAGDPLPAADPLPDPVAAAPSGEAPAEALSPEAPAAAGDDAVAAEMEAAESAVAEMQAGGVDAAEMTPNQPEPADRQATAGDVAATEPAEAAAETAADDPLAWDEFGAPEADPAVAPTQEPPAAPAEQPEVARKHIVMGPMAVDPEGREGRIHTVGSGDTLWDISEAYLGTPWVWPSVWTDNEDIQNPHLIRPGDHIWITSGEMRIVSRNEADSMIAAQQDLAQGDGAASDDWEPMTTGGELEPAELIEGPDEGDQLAGDDSPAALDPLSVAVPLEQPADGDMGLTIRIAELEAMGFVSAEDIDAASSVVDSPSPRTWLVDGDMIDVGMGEGQVEEGDEFTVFRNYVPVYDVEGNRLLGYHVHILGWAVVREVMGETALAEIRMSQSEMRRGDRLIPRPAIDMSVSIKTTPDAIEGQIVYMPDSRTRMGDGDHVYINRGSVHGFEVGSEVEVYAPGAVRDERVTGDRVMTPDRIMGRMVLVEVKPESSVAYVITANTELERGDRVRPSTRELASR